jgi:GPI mannosyltransferase 4
MALLKWIWAQDEQGLVAAPVIYYTLRLVMLALSFVLEDWAVHDLVRSPRHWRQAVILVTSSYVTWTFQTHTFSNSIETLVVLWSLVAIERILRENVSRKMRAGVSWGHALILHFQKRSAVASGAVLGFLLVFGTYNRITFPAFVVIPGIKLLPHFLNR